jgi:hypothetical protein
MAERAVGFDMLRETVRDPDSVEAGCRGRMKAVRRWGMATCVVVYELNAESEVQAITAFLRCR